MMKQWRVSDTKLASEMLGYLKRGLAKDAVISPEAVQYFLDLTLLSSPARDCVVITKLPEMSF